MRIHGDYEYRVAHIDARPPHTYEAALRIDVRLPGAKFTLAAPIAHVAAAGGAMRFEHLSAERQEQFARAQHELRQVQDDRRNLEIKANAEARASGGQPVRMNVHTSAVASARQPTSVAERVVAGPGPAAAGRPGVPGGSAPRPGTAPARKSDASGKGRDPKDRDKDQGGR